MLRYKCSDVRKCEKSAQFKVLRYLNISKSAQFKVLSSGLNLKSAPSVPVLRVQLDNIVISGRIQLVVLRTGCIIPKIVLKSECSDLAKFKKVLSPRCSDLRYFKKVLSFERSDIALKPKKCSDLVLR